MGEAATKAAEKTMRIVESFIVVVNGGRRLYLRYLLEVPVELKEQKGWAWSCPMY